MVNYYSSSFIDKDCREQKSYEYFPNFSLIYLCYWLRFK